MAGSYKESGLKLFIRKQVTFSTSRCIPRTTATTTISYVMCVGNHLLGRLTYSDTEPHIRANLLPVLQQGRRTNLIKTIIIVGVRGQVGFYLLPQPLLMVLMKYWWWNILVMINSLGVGMLLLMSFILFPSWRYAAVQQQKMEEVLE